MRSVVLLISCILFIQLQSQTIMKLYVKDAQTGEPLAFCNAIIEGSSKGAMTNNDGVVKLNVNENDVIVFSYLGYQTKRIKAENLSNNSIVRLQSKNLTISQIEVRPGTEYLYNFFTKCRKEIMGYSKPKTSKVYYAVESQSEVEPLEFIECYFNGEVNGVNLNSLLFRNGRVGFADVTDNYFMTKHTSKAFELFNITKNEGYFPINPLQCSKNKMKELFKLSLVSMDSTIYHIKFSPHNDDNTCFSGEIWLDTKDFSLLKIDFKADSTKTHPFLPAFSGDSLSNVSLSIANKYKLVDKTLVPEYLNLDYSFDYLSIRDTAMLLTYKKIKRKISSKGMMYFYDYSSEFIIPTLKYNLNYDDYRKISMIPFNDVFWNNNSIMILSDSQEEKLDYFKENGKLYNYNEENYGYNFSTPEKFWDGPYFEYYLSFWSKDKRIVLAKENRNNRPFPPEIINRSILSDLYSIKVQIILDITPLKDSIHCRTYTVFDGFNTYFHLPEETYTRAFLNIYFDICEMERRKLEKKLKKKNLSVQEIQEIYRLSMNEMKFLTRSYLRDVRVGKNFLMLKKWNQYVLDNLGIDNIELVDNTIEGN